MRSAGRDVYAIVCGCVRGCIAGWIEAGWIEARWEGKEPPSIAGKASFAELGVDSVGLIEIVYEVECALEFRHGRHDLPGSIHIHGDPRVPRPARDSCTPASQWGIRCG